MEAKDKDESEKTEEKAHIDKSDFVKPLILRCISLIRGVSLEFWKIITKKEHLALFTFILALFTCLLAVGTCRMARYTKGLAKANNELVEYMRKENEREAKLFVGKNKPHVVATPIGIIPGKADDGNKMCTTLFSVINHSGFVAYNIVIDVAYEGIVWISAWLEAEKDRKWKEAKIGAEKGMVIGQIYPSISKKNSFQLNPNESKSIGFTGSLDLEERVSSKGTEGFPVLVRIRWENDSGYVFDEVHKYKLTSTRSGEGRHFTFIPEGIISQKN